MITIILCLFAYLFVKYTFAWWIRINRSHWIYDNFYKKQVILEIKLPREIDKSPMAMELVLNGVHQVADYKTDFASMAKIKGFWDFWKHPFTNTENLRKWWWDGIVKAKTPMWMSLEVASLGGELHFYIVTVQKYQAIVSSYIYSQYPGVEIIEVEDYTNSVRAEFSFPGSEYELYTSLVLEMAKPDYLPIKTYMDFKLDKDPKEEYKIDPLVPLLESMASVGPDENVFYQVLAVATKDKSWTKPGQDRIDEILQITRDHGKVKEQKREMSKVSLKEKDEIEKIQRNIEKIGFDCNIKIIYSSKDKNNKSNGAYFANNNDQIVRNAMKPFENKEYNSFKLANQNAAFPWMDYPDARRVRRRRSGILFLYERRHWYYPEVDIDATPLVVLWERFWTFGFYEAKDYFLGDFMTYMKPGTVNPTFTLNAEELATIYHFPGKVLGAPSFDRVSSLKSEPPINLPV
jgi:hypothetical protein